MADKKPEMKGLNTEQPAAQWDHFNDSEAANKLNQTNTQGSSPRHSGRAQNQQTGQKKGWAALKENDTESGDGVESGKTGCWDRLFAKKVNSAETNPLLGSSLPTSRAESKSDGKKNICLAYTTYGAAWTGRQIRKAFTRAGANQAFVMTPAILFSYFILLYGKGARAFNEIAPQFVHFFNTDRAAFEAYCNFALPHNVPTGLDKLDDLAGHTATRAFFEWINSLSPAVFFAGTGVIYTAIAVNNFRLAWNNEKVLAPQRTIGDGFAYPKFLTSNESEDGKAKRFFKAVGRAGYPAPWKAVLSQLFVPIAFVLGGVVFGNLPALMGWEEAARQACAKDPSLASNLTSLDNPFENLVSSLVENYHVAEIVFDVLVTLLLAINLPILAKLLAIKFDKEHSYNKGDTKTLRDRYLLGSVQHGEPANTDPEQQLSALNTNTTAVTAVNDDRSFITKCLC